jgi:hypothetical protein
MVAKMDSRDSNSSPNNSPPLAHDFDLPVFDKPQIEPWPVKMSWSQAMRHLAASRSHSIRDVTSPEERLRGKNPARFVLP